ncbi:spinster family MFS transporter [Sphingomonas flavalba]|uniref:spinster family MFS transporter n=1 Tax=Sphingomonas flavalba TaxID=2559804 RepID=UPI001EEFD876|nr:MFS transporter [Sphingomonas flavalba]
MDAAADGRYAKARRVLRQFYRWYATALIAVGFFLSYVDRMALSLLVEDIKADLDITDFQFSLLQGLAFSLFYAVMGIPLGKLADSANRKKLLAACISLWSLFTAGCGMAQSFIWMFLCRIGVGVGEAGLTPAAYSVASDMFPKRQLGRATSIFTFGAYVGGGGGLIAVGLALAFFENGGASGLPWIGDWAPWRLTLIALGLPGVVLSLLILLTFREPLRGAMAEGEAVVERVSFRDTLGFLRQEWRVFLPLMLGTSLCAFVTYGSAAWAPAFFMRTFGWDPQTVAANYGTLNLAAAAIGPFVGGYLLDRASKGTDVARALSVLVIIVIVASCLAIAPLMESPAFALAFITVGIFAKTAYGTLLPALTQLMVPTSMRGQIVAIYVFASNIVGSLFGPAAIAAVTDFGFEDPNRLGLSMAIVAGSALPFAIGMFLLARQGARRAKR